MDQQLQKTRYTRYPLFALVLALEGLICVTWSDQHDWVKLPILIGLHSKAFEMLIARRPPHLVLTLGIPALGTIVYMILQYTVLQNPQEPVLVEQQAVIEFNTSSIGECRLTQGSEFCFTDQYLWHTGNVTGPRFDGYVKNGIDSLTALHEMEVFELTNEEFDQCRDEVVMILCNAFLPMCDHSCNPIKICHEVCLVARSYCGEVVGELLELYPNVLISMLQNMEATEEEIDTFISAISNIFLGCRDTFANESDPLCVSEEGYATNLSGISPDGACIRDNGIRYAEYQESLTSISLAQYLATLNEYQDDYDEVQTTRLIIAFVILLLTFTLQIVAFFTPRFRDKFYMGSYVVWYTDLALSSRLGALLSGFLLASLCVVNRSVIYELDLGGLFLILCILVVLGAGYLSTTCIFLQDRKASLHYLEITSPENMKSSRKFDMNNCVGNLYTRCQILYHNYIGENGRYERIIFILSEAVEVGLQVSVMFTLSRTDDTLTILIYISIISVNLMFTPMILLHPSPRIWRTLHRLVDSMFDLGYLGFLYFTLSTDGESSGRTSDVILGILYPSYRITARMYSLFSSITKENMRSFTHKTKKVTEDTQTFLMTKFQNLMRILIVTACVGCGALLLISSIVRVAVKMSECKQSVGSVIWNALDDHTIFPDGLLGDSTCNFDNVFVLNMSDSALTSLSGSIKNLGYLKVLDLSHNSLTTLPVELLELKHLTNLNVTGNPVSVKLEWNGLGLEYYPDQFFDLIPTLEMLDLSSNLISYMNDSSSSTLKSLTFLDLSGNELENVAEEYISRMISLKSLNLSTNNLVELGDVVWSISTLKNLDISSNLLTQMSYVWPTRSADFIVNVEDNPVTMIDWSWSGTGRQIFELPEEMKYLSQLTHFTATNQQIVIFGGLLIIESLTLLNLSHFNAISMPEICESNSIEVMDLSYSSDPYGIRNLYDCGSNFHVKVLNISGLSINTLAVHGSPVIQWVYMEHLVANDMIHDISNFTALSFGLSSFVNLKSLTFRNSNITGFKLDPIPANLTLIDLSNTSMSLNLTISTFPNFNCTYPVSFICTRSL